MLCIFLILLLQHNMNALPEGFAYLDPSITVNLKYFSKDNFIGEVIPSYKRNVGIMTKQAADALLKAQKKFNENGYSIVVYDAYRPQTAVDYFVKWMDDEKDTKRKAYHYPYVKDKRSMKGVYIAAKSGHSHGSTVDLTIIKNDKKLNRICNYEARTFGDKKYPFLHDNTVDCGTGFDLMDPISHPTSTLVTQEQMDMRNYIAEVMRSCGFKVLPEEWWHFTLVDEPFPETYFDFPVE